MNTTTPTLAAALAAFQGEISDPPKNKKGQVRGRNDYRYAGLDDTLGTVRPVLARHGLSVTQVLDLVGDRVALRTVLLHASGERIESLYPMGWGGTPQDHGSEMTYARRYSLEAILGVAATADDDGAAASKRGKGKAMPEDEAEEEGVEHHASWEADKRAFFAALSKATTESYDLVAEFCAAKERPRPSAMDNDGRRKLVAYLETDAGKASLSAFAAIGRAA